MLRDYGIRSLYPLALAEGEGVGTAYEYVAKRQVLRRWLPYRPEGKLLVAGLPEIYGTSLDYLLLAQDLDLQALVVDDQPALLERAQGALNAARQTGLLTDVKVDFLQVDDLTALTGLNAPFAWSICNEVLQRLDDSGRSRYVRRLAELSPCITLFAPNADNDSHTSISGLTGLHLAQMKELLTEVAPGQLALGYCDMPPFPPGITRSESQRDQAGSGRLEATAMWGLGQYLRLEPWLPKRLLLSRWHIIYGLYFAS